MPWISIITFILSFLFSRSQGNSVAKSAGIAALAGGTAYLTVDPANADNLLGIGQTPGTVGAVKGEPGSALETADTKQATGKSTAMTLVDKAGALADTTIKTVGSTLSSWGGAGTAAVIGTTTVASQGSKYVIWLALGVGAYLILK